MRSLFSVFSPIVRLAGLALLGVCWLGCLPKLDDDDRPTDTSDASGMDSSVPAYGYEADIEILLAVHCIPCHTGEGGENNPGYAEAGTLESLSLIHI